MELIDQLQRCETESELRAWLSATFDVRIILPERHLQWVERERAKREAIIAEGRRQMTARVAAMAAGAPERVKLAGRPQRSTSYRGFGGGSEIVAEVRRAIKRYGIPPSRFGREAVNDPGLVADLEKGREPRPKVKARLRAYIAALNAGEAAHG
jgi:hypothetical protein